LSKRLPEAQQQAALAEALLAARSVEHPYRRCSALIALSDHLPEAQRGAALAEALAVANLIPDEDPRSRALTRLTRRLPVELAWQSARQIEGGGKRSRALARLSERLPTRQKEVALAEALEVAKAIRRPLTRSKALAKVSGRLPRQQQDLALAEALQAASLIEDDDDRNTALTKYAALTEMARREHVSTDAHDALRACARCPRPAFLRDLTALLPLLERLGGPAALAQTAEAVVEVRRRWP
jgi:hypothetical protein